MDPWGFAATEQMHGFSHRCVNNALTTDGPPESLANAVAATCLAVSAPLGCGTNSSGPTARLAGWLAAGRSFDIFRKHWFLHN